MLWLVSFAFSEEEEDEEEHAKSCSLVFHTLLDISSIFLHAVTFSHVLYLDVLEDRNLSENRNFLMYGYNAEQPIL